MIDWNIKCKLATFGILKHEHKNMEIIKEEWQSCTVCRIELKETNAHPLETLRCPKCGFTTKFFNIFRTKNLDDLIHIKKIKEA